MTTTFYVDTNRQNASHKSKDTNSEWEYKLSNSMQLPAGTTIGIQDAFIHKQGISGATIEINENIEEELFFSVYLSDNPHFVPKNGFFDFRNNTTITNNHAYKPSFLPFGITDPRSFFGRFGNAPRVIDPDLQGEELGYDEMAGQEGGSSNAGRYTNMPSWGQRIALWEDDTETNPRIDGATWGLVNDPYTCGYSEYPMMAIFVDSDETYATNANDLTFGGQIAANVPLAEVGLNDPRFKPYVKSVKIFIPKGVYSVGELADLIDGQINGNYTNVKNDDFYQDSITKKINEQTYTGTLETDGIYSKVESYDRFSPGNTRPDKATNDAGTPDDELSAVLNQVAKYPNYNAGHGPRDEPAYFFPTVNPSGSFGLGLPFNDRYNLPYYDNIRLDIVRYNAQGQQENANVPKYALAYAERKNGGTAPNVTCIKGRQPVIPDKNQLMYIPVHYYNHLVQMWKYNDEGAGAAHQNSYLEKTGNWTINTKRMFRYAFQQRQNLFAPSVVNGDIGADSGNNGAAIGLHHVMKTNSAADWFHPGTGNTEATGVVGVTPTNFAYDIFKQGYYVGTPDFSFSYDSDKSSYSIQGLHQSKRMPSCDARGNPTAAEGQTGLYLKRTAEYFTDFFVNPVRSNGRVTTINGIPPNQQTDAQKRYVTNYNKNGGSNGFVANIKNVLNKNESRVGGVAIYNWAMTTARKLGDIKPETYQEPDYLGNNQKVYDDNYTYLWTFQEYFSTREKALAAWDTTIWARLGFSFDNLQNTDSWEKCHYYDLPVDKYDNQFQPDDSNPNNNHPRNDRMTKDNFYFEERTQMFFKNEDFKVYGKTTDASIGVDSAPTISTTFNNKIFDYTPDKTPEVPSPSAIPQIIRTYDNHDTATPFLPTIAALDSTLFPATNPVLRSLIKSNGTSSSADGNLKAHPAAFDTSYGYDNSLYGFKSCVPVSVESKEILASKLPQLSTQGYYLVSSDIIDGYQDDTKQGNNLPLLGIVPISNLSNQDFIAAQSDITHTLQQAKVLNSIKIKILNPDLTSPILKESSSVILSITTPLPQQSALLGPPSDNTNNKEETKKAEKRREKQPNPHTLP